MSYGPYTDPNNPYPDPPKPYDSAPSGFGAPYSASPVNQPYGSSQFGGYPPPPAGTNAMCVISLVAGIVGWVFCFGLGGVVALITGFIGRNQVKTSGEDGDGLAIAGLIIGGLNVLAAVGLFILWLVLLVGIGISGG